MTQEHTNQRGDYKRKTKPSQYTQKFKRMYGEKLGKNADMGDYIKDFQKSDAPQFKGKSKEKRKDMAILHTYQGMRIWKN